MRSNAPSRSRRASPSARRSVPEEQRIAFRIGINIGDIIIEDGDIYGDGVNVAARLERWPSPARSASPAPSTTSVKAKLAFGFEPMGEHRVKNIPSRSRCIRVVAGRRRSRGRSAEAAGTHEALGMRRGGGRAPGGRRRRRAVAPLASTAPARIAADRDAGDCHSGTAAAVSRRLWTGTGSRCCRSRTSAPIPRTSTSPTV